MKEKAQKHRNFSRFHRCGNRGVSLIEIMVSVLIFGTCLLPVFELLSRSAQIARVTHEEIVSFNLAAELVDQVCCMPFDAIPVMNEFPLKNSDNGAVLFEGKIATRLILSNLPEGYDRSLTVEAVSQRLKLVRAKLEWGTNPRRKLFSQALFEWTP